MQELYRRHISARGFLLSDDQIKVESGLSSTFHEACLDLVGTRDPNGDPNGVQPIILSAAGEMTRAPHDEHCICTGSRLERLVGINVRSVGIGRAVREAVGGTAGCKRWEELAMAAVLAMRQAGGHRYPDPYTAEARQADINRMRETMATACRRFATFIKTDFEGYDVPAGYRPRVRETYRSYWNSSVFLTDPQTLLVQASFSDPFHYPWLEMEVDVDSRRITRIHGELSRSPRGPICCDTAELLQNLVGQPAWPGDSKAVRDAVGGSDGCSRFEEIVNEAYRAVFQAHYALALRQHVGDPAGTRHALYRLIKDTCGPYSEFGADPQWNPEAARVQAADVAD